MARPRMLEGASLVVVGLALLAGAILTRGRDVDALVDFGRELYVAWRISEGEHLYADLRYEYGPISPYLNGLVFWIFGPGIRVLEAFNLMVLAATTAMWHRLLFVLGGPLAALVGSLGFLALFAFGHFEPGVVFHYLAPYSHAPIHGLALGIATVLLVRRHLERGGATTAAGLGACAGLAFLIKPEVTLAVGAAAAMGWLGGVWLGRRSPWAQLAAAGLGFLGAVASVALALGLAGVPVGAGLLGAWRPLLDPAHMGSHFASFSSHVLGLDDVGASIGISAVACLAWAVLLLPGLLVARLVPDTPRARWFGAGLACAAVAGLGIPASWGWAPEQWQPWGAPVLLFCLVTLALGLAALVRRGPGVDPVGDLTTLSLCLLALGFLSRTGLRPRFFDYGFVAAMPAFGITVLALLRWIPDRLTARGRAGAVFRGAAVGFFTFLVVGHLALSQRTLEVRRTPIGRGADRILAGARGPILAETLEWIEREVPEGAPLLVVPEGVMLNYLSRRPSTTSHLSFIPPLVAWFGEDAIVRELAARPPGHVLIVDRETGEFGPLRFGADYARELGGYLQEHYRPVARIGAAPFTGAGFGAVLLEPRGPGPRPEQERGP